MATLLLSQGNLLILAGPAIIALGIYLIITQRNYIPLLFIVGSFFILRNRPGFSIDEVIFYSILSLLLIFVLFPDAIRLQLKLTNKVDYAFLILFGLVLYGLILGFYLRNGITVMLIDGSIYAAIFAYFPFRKYLSSSNNRNLFLITVLILIVFICVRNFLNYQQIILQATMAWELELARAAVNEVLILFGSVVTLVLFSYAKEYKTRLIWGSLLVLFLLGLILTQSRGFWITFVLSTFVFLYFADSKPRFFAVSIISTVLIGVILVVVVFFYDLLELVIYGFQTRILSLLEANQDVSLLERVAESQTVLKLIAENPIAGHGLGSQYIRHNILFGNVFKATHYIHNGYVSLWFKYGLLGLIVMPYLYIITAKYAYVCFKNHVSPLGRQLSLGILCIIPPLMILNMTSPVYVMFDGLLFITISGAYVSTLHEDLQNYSNPQ
jgi:O-antigen ligase